MVSQCPACSKGWSSFNFIHDRSRAQPVALNEHEGLVPHSFKRTYPIVLNALGGPFSGLVLNKSTKRASWAMKDLYLIIVLNKHT